MTSTEDECDVSSLPKDIQPNAANTSEAESNATDTETVSSEEEEKSIQMAVDGGEMTDDEKALELSPDMQETCQGKSVRKTKNVGMTQEDYDRLKSGGVVALPSSARSMRGKRDSDGCNKLVRCFFFIDQL